MFCYYDITKIIIVIPIFVSVFGCFSITISIDKRVAVRYTKGRGWTNKKRRQTMRIAELIRQARKGRAWASKLWTFGSVNGMNPAARRARRAWGKVVFANQ